MWFSLSLYASADKQRCEESSAYICAVLYSTPWILCTSASVRTVAAQQWGPVLPHKHTHTHTHTHTQSPSWVFRCGKLVIVHYLRMKDSVIPLCWPCIADVIFLRDFQEPQLMHLLAGNPFGIDLVLFLFL